VADNRARPQVRDGCGEVNDRATGSTGIGVALFVDAVRCSCWPGQRTT
jgi:hypothetical protein